jgi:hypothetical protein
MGEIAEMMLEGILDCETGKYLGEPCGYPRSASSEHEDQAAARAKRTRERRARRKRSAAKKKV